MTTTAKLSGIIGILGIISFPMQGFAANTSNNMSKDAWLDQLKTLAPTMICKSFMDDKSIKKQLDERQITNEKCVSLIPNSFQKCQTKYYSSLPATIDEESGSKWGHKIGECIGVDFVTNYLYPGSGPNSPDTSSGTTTTDTSTTTTPSSSTTTSTPPSSTTPSATTPTMPSTTTPTTTTPTP